MHNSWFRKPIACLVLLLQLACYSTRPLTDSYPQPETQIVAQLTDEGTVAMANAIGPGAQEVEGIVARADASSWTLRMLRVDQRGGISTPWKREEVTFPRSALTHVDVKRLDKKKSWVFAGMLTAAAVLAGVSFGVFTIGSEPQPAPPPPQ
jgi:hypothetical protein